MSTRLRCIVVEDEPLAREGLVSYIQQVSFLELRKTCDTALAANQVLGAESIDLMFLDIHMPGLTGIELLRSLRNPPMVVFTTAYPNFALDGYELDVLDYLVKPFPFDRFLRAANKALDYFSLKNASAADESQNYFFVKCDYRFEKINFRDILWVEGMENYVVIHTTGRKYTTLLRMKTVEETLPGKSFLRTHKSYIVSLQSIDSIDGNEVVVGTKRIPVSRDKKNELLERLLKNPEKQE